MCLSKPSIPSPPPPPQAAKAPDRANPANRRNTDAMGGGTLLTGPSGIANSALNTGKTTLLGG